MNTPIEHETREALRRKAYELKVALAELADQLAPIEPSVAASARQARLFAFETWTILATPIDGDDDDHAH